MHSVSLAKRKLTFSPFFAVADIGSRLSIEKALAPALQVTKDFNMEIKKDDLPKLEFMLNKMIDTNWLVQAEDFVSDGIYRPSERDILFLDFKYFLSIFEHYQVGTVNFEEDSLSVRPSINTVPFKRNGGFQKLYDDSINLANELDKKQQGQIRKQVQEEIIRQNSIEKFQYDIYGFWIAVISLIGVLISLAIQLTS
ncbi:hypothetical protein ACEZ3G_17020 [Maribacter algicola]|uniref:Uncharacterized protein n=1 Tax=Meishania litoralis TaxID=3434685 RepID=A0ACC7LQ79_9FLAO